MRNAAFMSRAQMNEIGFARLGADVLIHPSCVFVGCEAIAIGDNVRIDPFCVLTAKELIDIGENVHIGSHCNIVGAAGVRMGESANLSQGVRVFSESDDLAASGLIGAQAPRDLRVIKSGLVEISAFATVGANSVVLPGVMIGEGATLGALSLARADLEPWSINAGCPSRKVGVRDRATVLTKAE
jgi:galactoside O-acetyltransferase